MSRRKGSSNVTQAIIDAMLKKGGRGKRGGIWAIVAIVLAFFCFSLTSRTENERDDVSRDSEYSTQVQDDSSNVVTDSSYHDASDVSESSASERENSFPENDDARYRPDFEVDPPSVNVAPSNLRQVERAQPKGERVRVQRCVDGDTIIVINSLGRNERVRFTGCDTPETVKQGTPVEPFGPEASAYTKRRIAEANNEVLLVSDGDEYDKYGRRLAFVYLGNDDVSLNEELCRRGLARTRTEFRFSNEMKARLSKAAESARRERLGIYSLSN